MPAWWSPAPPSSSRWLAITGSSMAPTAPGFWPGSGTCCRNPCPCWSDRKLSAARRGRRRGALWRRRGRRPGRGVTVGASRQRAEAVVDVDVLGLEGQPRGFGGHLDERGEIDLVTLEPGQGLDDLLGGGGEGH